MEGRKQSGSSFASDLFGAKDSSAATDSSSGTFRSLFASPARASGGESMHLPEAEKKKKTNGSMSEARSVRTGISNDNPESGQEQSRSAKSNDFSPYYQEQKAQPFHYSSSIYYGGQDVYFQPQSTENPGLTTFSTEIGEDDKGLASRGNWWQGSLYY